MELTKIVYETGTDIVALSTPYASSALCVIRASGDTVRKKIARIFSNHKKLLSAEGRGFFHGRLKSLENGIIIDEVVLLYSQNPRSYTGEDVIEIMGHGSLPGIEAILKLCLSTGMRQALPGEFTFRAFVNGKIDLTQAEAVHEIVVSGDEQSHLMAMKRLSGALEKEVRGIKDILVDFMAQLNLQLDYAEDDASHDHNLSVEKIDLLLTKLQELEGSYELAQRHKNGFKTVLIGKTNAGKSSLFNLLLRNDRSIVSDLHGTTRDYIEEQIILSGNVIHIFDTAGLRETEEKIEQEGIRRSQELLNQAQIILYIQSSCELFSKKDKDFIRSLNKERKKIILVINKVDLLDTKERENWNMVLKDIDLPFVYLSTVNLFGIKQLKSVLEEALVGLSLPAGDRIYIESKRQADLITRAREALQDVKLAILAGLPFDLLAVDCERALSALGEITGEVTREDILERMFSSFCLGK